MIAILGSLSITDGGTVPWPSAFARRSGGKDKVEAVYIVRTNERQKKSMKKIVSKQTVKYKK